MVFHDMPFHGHAMCVISPQAWNFMTVMLPACMQSGAWREMLLVNTIDLWWSFEISHGGASALAAFRSSGACGQALPL